jgi:hypothetical protein
LLVIANGQELQWLQNTPVSNNPHEKRLSNQRCHPENAQKVADQEDDYRVVRAGGLQLAFNSGSVQLTFWCRTSSGDMLDWNVERKD